MEYGVWSMEYGVRSMEYGVWSIGVCLISGGGGAPEYGVWPASGRPEATEYGVCRRAILLARGTDQILPMWAGSCFAAGRLVPLPDGLKGWARPVEDCVSVAGVDIIWSGIGLRGCWLVRWLSRGRTHMGGYNHLLMYS